MANIFGAYDSRDLESRPVSDFTESKVFEDIQRFAQQYQRGLQLLIQGVAAFGTDAKTEFGTSVGGELQVQGEYSQGVEATKTEGKWEVGFPLLRFGDRQIYTKEYLARATLQKLQTDIIAAAVRDATTMRKIILRALLLKTNYTFNDKKEFPTVGLGSITIYRLFNNDSATGEIFVDGAAVSIGSLQHYITNANASINNAVFTLIRDKLNAAGLGADIVFWISRTNEAAVKALTDFVPPAQALISDPAAKSAIIRSPQAIGRMEDGNGEVQVMPFMPAGYVFGYDRAAGPPVFIRETEEPEFRGFKLVGDDTRVQYDEHPIRNKHWERIAGAGVKNRANGVALFVDAGGTYTDPSI